MASSRLPLGQIGGGAIQERLSSPSRGAKVSAVLFNITPPSSITKIVDGNIGSKDNLQPTTYNLQSTIHNPQPTTRRLPSLPVS